MADVSQIRLPNGDTFDLIDEKSGYITAQYIENKTDYSIPVSRVGEIVVGETAIGTDSTNFPTSKAVVDYVDERVVQEMDAIDVGVTSVNGKTGSVTLSASDIGAATTNQIPTSTSQLTNDSGFITSDSDEKVKQVVVSSDTNKGLPVMLAPAVNGTNTSTAYKYSGFTFNPYTSKLSVDNIFLGTWSIPGKLQFMGINFTGTTTGSSDNYTITLPAATGTVALTSDIPTVPTTVSSFTNDSGYLTASDIASVMTYKGTKANYAALPSTGNTTGDVWHLTDTGAEWAWDGSAWQELGTAIDLSSYATKATTLAGYGITDAKIENGTITLGSNTITPLTSFIETDPTVPSWAKASTKPSYGLTEISGTDDLRAIESLTGTSGLLKKTAANTWTLDTNTYLTSYTETDPTVPSWAKASTKPTYTAAEVGALPDSTVIPSKTSDLTNDSGFITSYTDEKLGLSLASSPVTYYPILTQDTTTAGKKSYDNNGFKYYNYNGTTSDVGNAQLTLGNNKTATTVQNKRGTLELYGSTAYAIRITAGAPTVIRNIEFPNKDGTVALTSDIPTVPTKVSDLTNDSGFISSYTETDPVFGASAAAGITSTDISNWNAKVSDDKTWNGVTLNKSVTTATSDLYIPCTTSTSNTAAYLIKALDTSYSGGSIARRTSAGYLYAATPSANDNSTKVATTAYVDNAIPKVYSSTNTGGYLTMATLPIYDGTVV